MHCVFSSFDENSRAYLLKITGFDDWKQIRAVGSRVYHRPGTYLKIYPRILREYDRNELLSIVDLGVKSAQHRGSAIIWRDEDYFALEMQEFSMVPSHLPINEIEVKKLIHSISLFQKRAAGLKENIRSIDRTMILGHFSKRAALGSSLNVLRDFFSAYEARSKMFCASLIHGDAALRNAIVSRDDAFSLIDFEDCRRGAWFEDFNYVATYLKTLGLSDAEAVSVIAETAGWNGLAIDFSDFIAGAIITALLRTLYVQTANIASLENTYPKMRSDYYFSMIIQVTNRYLWGANKVEDLKNLL